MASFNTLYVVGSIITVTKQKRSESGFNTLYVVGSKTENIIRATVFEFQYIICCWFNKKKSSF